MDKKKPLKKWTEPEEIELGHHYSSLHWSFAELAKWFGCTVKEVRGKEWVLSSKKLLLSKIFTHVNQ